MPLMLFDWFKLVVFYEIVMNEGNEEEEEWNIKLDIVGSL